MFYTYECDCGVMMVIPKELVEKANIKALVGKAVHQAGANPECN